MMTLLLGLGQSSQGGFERRAGLAKPRGSLRLVSQIPFVSLSGFHPPVFPHVRMLDLSQGGG